MSETVWAAIIGFIVGVNFASAIGIWLMRRGIRAFLTSLKATAEETAAAEAKALERAYELGGDQLRDRLAAKIAEGRR